MHVPEINLLFFIVYPFQQDLRTAKCIQIDRILAQKVINRYFLFIVTASLAQSRVTRGISCIRKRKFNNIFAVRFDLSSLERHLYAEC
ncbi:hypothetical protein ELH42_34530 [Rhizobium ruizarguesonis]|uniref:Uncharacterized protein n=1 Tax=Rhizobium ruizarguesonis TaxID=2081791 RepID=A0AB38HU84_9HYPH|nr:hypothetical protein ELH68_03080 [Rhizobium ruizarguesonis]TAZ90596.1 hypothetical protein ELH64_32720 [Rhizobium ruizarguesonis]TBA13378.1 hypothetical protein ELH61_31050 [Rhizobium ruizarguesonis]TBA31926.1 hypothetical protein ELH62_34740 [Rhizobium ruizarguesonis]TBA52995.1 hypothetical protein ELH57_35265 [Rhizobium ruizarguesonis]